MACDSDVVMKVAVLEDGSASVNLPVSNWQDVKAVHTVGQYEGAAQALLADSQVRIYGGPSGAMVDVCLEFWSKSEKEARDKAQLEMQRANVSDIQDHRVAEAEAELASINDAREAEVRAKEAEARAEADRIAQAEQRLKDAEALVEQRRAERDDALRAVDVG